jgi:hypothetical protein
MSLFSNAFNSRPEVTDQVLHPLSRKQLQKGFDYRTVSAPWRQRVELHDNPSASAYLQHKKLRITT